MRSCAPWVVGCSFLSLLGPAAFGAPLTFQLAPGSSLQWTVSSPTWQVSDSATQAFSGSITADLTFGTQAPFGQVATMAGLVDADLSAADVGVQLDLGFLGALAISTSGVGAKLSGPTSGFVPPPSGTGITNFALPPAIWQLDQGSLTYEGQGIIATAVGSSTTNLASSPLVFDFLSGSQFTVALTGASTPSDKITLTIPIQITERWISDPFLLDVTLSGTLVATYMDECVVSALVGDANNDGSVGAADYAIWAAQFGQSGDCLAADFDRSGSVGAGDYTLWAANFGNTLNMSAEPPGALAASISVPEPTAWRLGLVALASLATLGSTRPGARRKGG